MKLTYILEYPEIIIYLLEGKNAYFASDFHLDIHQGANNLRRESNIVRWLREIKPYCGALFLVGDIFDFWHEYKYVVPKGNIRLLGTLADYRDSGIPIYIFTGNHDIWMYD